MVGRWSRVLGSTFPMNALDVGFYRAGGVFDLGALAVEGLFIEPNDGGIEGMGCVGRGLIAVDEHIPTADIHFIGDAKHDRLRCKGRIDGAFVCIDRFDVRGFPAWKDRHAVTCAEYTRGDGSGKSAIVKMRSQHQLNGETEGLVFHITQQRDFFEETQQRAIGVPRGAFAWVEQVVAFEGADGKLAG